MIAIERPVRHKKTMQLTALIDVLFQLLIFFMLSTSFVRQESIELALPNRRAPKQTTASSVVWRVEVNAGGQLRVNGAAMPSNQANEQLRQQFARLPDTGVLIVSAKGVNLQELVSVMDMIYTAGGKNVAVSSDKTKPVRLGESPQNGAVAARMPWVAAGEAR